MSRRDTAIDLVSRYKLRTFFENDFTEHHRITSDRTRGVRRYTEVQKWYRVKELGRGGFGVVFLEEDAAGELRAVKDVRKQNNGSQTVDWFRELLAMAYFSTVQSLEYTRMYALTDHL
jgi:hypothetical protein